MATRFDCRRQCLPTEYEGELMQFAAHLHSLGARPLFYFLRDICTGRPLAETLEDFSRVHPGTYAAVMAQMATGGEA